MIPTSLVRGLVRCTQQRIHFRFLERRTARGSELAASGRARRMNVSVVICKLTSMILKESVWRRITIYFLFRNGQRRKVFTGPILDYYLTASMSTAWRVTILILSCAIALLVAAYWSTAQSMAEQWRTPTYSYAWFILPISLYLGWRIRRDLESLGPSPSFGCSL